MANELHEFERRGNHYGLIVVGEVYEEAQSQTGLWSGKEVIEGRRRMV